MTGRHRQTTDALIAIAHRLLAAPEWLAERYPDHVSWMRMPWLVTISTDEHDAISVLNTAQASARTTHLIDVDDLPVVLAEMGVPMSLRVAAGGEILCRAEDCYSMPEPDCACCAEHCLNALHEHDLHDSAVTS